MRDEKRPVWCRHHRKPEPMVDACELGVDINAMAPRGMFGRFYALPCHDKKSDGIEKATCDKCSLFTPEEVAQQDADEAEWFKGVEDRLRAMGPLIQAMKATTHERGADYHLATSCPVCGGMLHASCSIHNLHVRAKCETPDCINFME